MIGGPFRGLLMRQLAEVAALAADRAERYRRTVDAATADDTRRDAERETLGLPRLGPSLVPTPEQTDALRAGSLDLADVLPPDPWAEMLGADYATRISEACVGEWERLSDFGIRRRLYWPGRGEWERWRARRVPEERKRRADRKRSDRKRRNNPPAAGAIRARNENVSERSAPIPD